MNLLCKLGWHKWEYKNIDVTINWGFITGKFQEEQKATQKVKKCRHCPRFIDIGEPLVIKQQAGRL